MSSTLVLETSPTPSPPSSSFPPYCYSVDNLGGCKPFYSASAYGYRPSIAASSIFMTVFSCALISILAIGLATRRWIVFNGPIAIACILSVVGYAARLASWFRPWDLQLYAVSISFISLVPGFISSSIYFITPYTMTLLSNSSNSSRLSPIRPQTYARLSLFDVLGLILQIIGLVLSFVPSFSSSSFPSMGTSPSDAASAIPSLAQAYGPDGYPNASATTTPGFGSLALVGNPLVAAGTAVQSLGLLTYLALSAIVLVRRRQARKLPPRSWPASRERRLAEQRNGDPNEGIIFITTAPPTRERLSEEEVGEKERLRGSKAPCLPRQPTPVLFLQPPSPREDDSWNHRQQQHHRHSRISLRPSSSSSYPFPSPLFSQQCKHSHGHRRKQNNKHTQSQKPLPPLPFRSHALVAVLILAIICLLIRNLYWCACVFGPGLAGPAARDEVRFTALQSLLVVEAVVMTLCGAHPARFLPLPQLQPLSGGGANQQGKGKEGKKKGLRNQEKGQKYHENKRGFSGSRRKGLGSHSDLHEDDDDALLPPLPPLPPPPPVASWEGKGRGMGGGGVGMRVSSPVGGEKVSLRTGSIMDVMLSAEEEVSVRRGAGGADTGKSSSPLCSGGSSAIIDSDVETGVRSSWSSWGSVETVLPRWNLKRYRF